MAAAKIAVIEGDGIGKEVVPEGMRVVEAAAARLRVSISAGTISTGAATIMPGSAG